ncbi:glycoside hydrolase [Penicillium verhagenii]|nr:glycoside hydrolase [Penicillium verhagenii]
MKNFILLAFVVLVAHVTAAAVNPDFERAHYGHFEYPRSTPRYASSITPKPQPTYANSANMRTLLTSQKYTTWASIATPTDRAQYGNSAWSELWTTIPYISPPQITTTVTPTPIPSSQLIFPLQYYDVDSNSNKNRSLPANFIWGLAGSAIQIEGANLNEGRGPSALDSLYAMTVQTDSNATDVNYYLYKQDIARLAAIGVPHYSFTISWTRILPFGTPGSPINQEGIDHYNDVINTCLEYGIIPIVTMCHFDPPTVFGTAKHYPTYGLNTVANIGLNNDTIVPAFVNYARILFAHYADRVPYWITLNEPEYVAGSFLGVRNVIRLHSQTAQIYREDVKGTGKISFKNVHSIGIPLNLSNSEDLKAANRYNDFGLGPLSYPIAFGKAYPQSILDTYGSQLENYTRQELELAKGSCDFYAIDAYSGYYIQAPPNGVEACSKDASDPNFPICAITSSTGLDGWDNGYLSEQDVLTAAPTFLRTALNYIWDIFRPSGILVSEYGFPVSFEDNKSLAAARFDIDRSTYYSSYNMEILKAVHDDGVNVIGAIGWGVLDDWELGDTNLRFGVQYVNYTTLERFYKSSIFALVDFYDRYLGK